jgi:hypothetical protein
MREVATACRTDSPLARVCEPGVPAGEPFPVPLTDISPRVML